MQHKGDMVMLAIDAGGFAVGDLVEFHVVLVFVVGHAVRFGA